MNQQAVAMPTGEHIADYNVIVVGSGAAGMLAAARLHDLGLRPAVIEKSSLYGGTSAMSGGGIWIPCNGLSQEGDSRDAALAYLKAVSKGSYREDKLEAYLDTGAEMVCYLNSLGVEMISVPGFPDYIAAAPGATSGRSLFPGEIDGKSLGEDFERLRDFPEAFKLFGRYVLDLEQSLTLGERKRGWQIAAARLLARYWLDLPWRRRTRLDRRLTMGRALCGGLRRALRQRGVPVFLDCAIVGLVTNGNRVAGIEAEILGKRVHFAAPRGVVLCAGGFEQNQALRDKYLPVHADRGWSLTPAGMNVGDGLVCGEAIGADSETLDANWWAPSILLPSRTVPNLVTSAPMFFDHRHPFSLCVNGLGERFVNESCSYDEFGQAMIADQQRTGANVPCWFVFDAKFRERYPCGPILPGFVMSDDSVPVEWWDSYIFRAASIEALAAKIRVPASSLEETVARMNAYASTGIDEQFHRGENAYDRFFGKDDVTPNPCFGPIDKAPYYAVRIELGDLGSKGGLKTDCDARVLSRTGVPIEGLYAAGNNAGSPFGNCYPGAGGTLGPATVFAYIAAGHLAGR